ncbi:glycosyltransferase family 39 protein [Roseospira navarrensis]|uniref:Glycosyltransferase RgtA/B/C/D-like domain-containing protein n=1 Tax=Roseospira navarrensis TaxID=140058 RepID=A0A7X2D4U4_9PROT|nr:glycosyltransferase family 39 protein [Roseospira navarrensis]MQX38211.1 hypothetical protein [Roseospira navarrensis]
MSAFLCFVAALGRLFTRPAVAFGAVAVLLAGVVAIQVGWQTGGRNDDAEVLLFSQTLALGYDALNPPLVIWLHWLVAQVTGPTLLSTRLVVVGLLFAAYPLAWAAARSLTPDRGMATLAGFSLAGLVAWNWAPHLNLSHTVAMTTAGFALLWVTLRLVERPTWGAWLLAGLVAGLGLLTKYNFVLLLAAVVLAGLMTPTTRRVLLSRRAAVGAAVTFLVAAPHYVWLLWHWSAFSRLFDAKLGRDAPEAGGLEGLQAGLLLLGEHALMVVLPAVALALLLFAPAAWRALVRPADIAPVRRDRLVFAGLVPLVLLLILAALVLVAGVTDLGPHHVYGLILVVAPLFAWLARGAPGDRARGLFVLVTLGLCLAVPVFLARMIVTTAETCESKCNTALPYETYAAELKEAGFAGGTVVIIGSVHHFPMVPLRPLLPPARYMKPLDSQKADFAPPPLETPGDCLVLWADDQDPDMPDRLRVGIPGHDAPLPDDAVVGVSTGRLALSGRPAHPLGYALVKGGVGTCR